MGGILNNLSYTTEGLTYANGTTYVCGGYCIIGKLVIVDITIKPGIGEDWKVAVHGLPRATNNVYSPCCDFNQHICFIQISSTGAISLIRGHVIGIGISVTCCYLKSELCF